jgi:hypothetical protein
MTIPLDDPRLDSLRDAPPVMRFRGNDGSTVTEPLTFVGNVCAPLSAREQLEQYAVYLLYARHNSTSGCWEGCLISEPALRTLLELRAEGQFPYAIEAVPSQAEAEWRLAQAAGATERAPAPLRLYVTPASLEALAKLTAILKED